MILLPPNTSQVGKEVKEARWTGVGNEESQPRINYSQLLVWAGLEVAIPGTKDMDNMDQMTRVPVSFRIL